MLSRVCKFFVIITALVTIGRAQSTTVTATVIDQLGVTWANATGLVTFAYAPGISPPYTWSGGSYNAGPIPFSTDASGHFSISLPSNCAIVPSGSTWSFSIAPNQSSNSITVNAGICG